MTLIVDQTDIAVDAINWSVDGAELHTGAIDAIERPAAAGVAVALAVRGITIAYTKTGYPAPPCIGVQPATRAVIGLAVDRTSRGTTVSLAKSGHD